MGVSVSVKQKLVGNYVMGRCNEKVCEEGKRWQEIQHLRQVFSANGYPEPVVKNNLRGRPTSSNTTMESETSPKLLHLPYVKEVSERI